MASIFSEISDELVEAALSNNWVEAFRLCHHILNDAENPDQVILGCCDRLPMEHGETLFEVARDAAGDFLVDDSTGEGDAVSVLETSYMLFAVPVVVLPDAVYEAADFEAVAATLRRVTGEENIIVIPELVRAEDFLPAGPVAIREIVARIDMNRVEAAGLDVLEPIRTSPADPGAGARLVGFILGVRIESFKGGTDVLPETWIGKCEDAPYELFRKLLKDQESKFHLAEWPMPAGMVIPQANHRLEVERLVQEIAEIGRALDVLPDAMVYEDEREQKSYVAFSVEGHFLSELVVDRSHSTLEPGDVVSTMKAVGILVRETLSPREFSAFVMAGSAMN